MRKLFPLLAAFILLSGCDKHEAAETASSPAKEAASRLVILNERPATPGAAMTLRAVFGEDAATRSRLEMNADESALKVLWTRGDKFYTVFDMDPVTGHWCLPFETSDDGVASAAFTSPYDSYFAGNQGFYCFYPDGPAVGYDREQEFWFFGLDLPSGQTAVPGGIEEGLNRSFAYADELRSGFEQPVRFQNEISLLKFRLSGEVVSRVRDVTFSCGSDISGDRIFRVADGNLQELPGDHFNEAYTQVSLQGTFGEDTDYYIALWPASMSGFRMVFSDGDGNSTTLRSSKSVTFDASRTKDFGTIDLGDEFTEIDDGSMDPILYMAATEGTKPVTIAVIPDGFTKTELPKYEELAKYGIDALFGTEPYKTYRNRFNVYILKVDSPNSGASVTDGNGNIITDTGSYFGSRWGEDSYNDMRANDQVVFDFVKKKCPDIVNGVHKINEVPILIIINDSRYGGICWSWSDGQGYAMVPYTDEGDELMWGYASVVPNSDDPLPDGVTSDEFENYYHYVTDEEYDEVGYNEGDWRNTLTHEFGGHCFGRLADEYWSARMKTSGIDRHNWPVPFSLNVSSTPYVTPWDELLDDRSNLVMLDPHYGRIGAFQGGDGCLFGRWRSEKISCMIDNRYYFSAWQRYLITRRIFTLSDDLAQFNYDFWLDNDKTDDPVRDLVGSGAPARPGSGVRKENRRILPPLAPPVLVD